MVRNSRMVLFVIWQYMSVTQSLCKLQAQFIVLVDGLSFKDNIHIYLSWYSKNVVNIIKRTAKWKNNFRSNTQFFFYRSGSVLMPVICSCQCQPLYCGKLKIGPQFSVGHYVPVSPTIKFIQQL